MGPATTKPAAAPVGKTGTQELFPMLLASESIEISPADFAALREKAALPENLSAPGHYLRVVNLSGSWGIRVNDLHILRVDEESLLGLNPGNGQRCEYFFDDKRPEFSGVPMKYGRDWFLIAASDYRAIAV